MEFIQQIDAECVLHDAMDNICKYLDSTDLNNVSKVCKSWCDAAQREVSRRYQIKQLRLPYEFSNSSKSWDPILAKMLDVNPHVSLLFYDNKMYEWVLQQNPFTYWVEEKLLEDFKKKLECKVGLLRVCEYLTTEKIQSSGAEDQRELRATGNSSVLGLFFPSVKRRVRVDVAWAKGDHQLDAHYMADKLGLNNCERTKSTLLMFTYSEEGFRIANALANNRIKDNKETVWAVGFHKKLLASDCHYKRYRSEQCIVALRISGPSVESWTTLIDCYSESEAIERQLFELKKQVKLRRHTTGLLSAPRREEYDNSREIMSSVKAVFPHIPFTGLFNKCSWIQLTDENGLNCNEEPSHFWHVNRYISIIIVAYD